MIVSFENEVHENDSQDLMAILWKRIFKELSVDQKAAQNLHNSSNNIVRLKGQNLGIGEFGPIIPLKQQPNTSKQISKLPNSIKPNQNEIEKCLFKLNNFKGEKQKQNHFKILEM